MASVRCKRKAVSGLEGLLIIVGLGDGGRWTHLEGWRERIQDCRSCSVETAVAKIVMWWLHLSLLHTSNVVKY